MIDPIFEKINRLMKEIFEDIESAMNGELSSTPIMRGYKLYWDNTMEKPLIEEFSNAPTSLSQQINDDVKTLSDYEEPLVDVFEDEEQGVINIYAHVPGITSKDQLAITIADDILKIEADNGTRKYRKTITLGKSVEENYDVELNNGVLTLTLRIKNKKH